MTALVFLNFSGRAEWNLYLTGMFLILFLPMAALLIGSGGFLSEYKDNAWIYIFSRPVRKESIWLSKYFSQLSILLIILIVFFLFKSWLPGLEKAFIDLDLSQSYGYGNQFFLSQYVILPLFAFTLAFSFSIIHDKPFVIFFTAVLSGSALVWISREINIFLILRGVRNRNLNIFLLAITLSFMTASLMTFIKSDFSQAKKKLFRFIKYSVIFLLLTLSLSTVWTAKARIFFPRKSIIPIHVMKAGNNLYFYNYNGGIWMFDSGHKRITPLDKNTAYARRPFSLRSGKIVYLKSKPRKHSLNKQLWIRNADGTRPRPLIVSGKKKGPLQNPDIQSFILSADVQIVAFTTSQSLWSISLDGTNKLVRHFDSPKEKPLSRILAWPPDSENIYILVPTQRNYWGPPQPEMLQIIKINLTDGSTQIVTENLPAKLWFKYGFRYVSPRQTHMVWPVYSEDENKDFFYLYKLDPIDKTRLFSAPHTPLWGIKWNPNGDKLAVSMQKEILIYDLKSEEVITINRTNNRCEAGFDWTSDGESFLYITLENGESTLIITDRHFNDQDKIELPPSFNGIEQLWSGKDTVLIRERSLGELWQVNLVTKRWEKIK
jgi:hypothetical protein